MTPAWAAASAAVTFMAVGAIGFLVYGLVANCRKSFPDGPRAKDDERPAPIALRAPLALEAAKR